MRSTPGPAVDMDVVGAAVWKRWLAWPASYLKSRTGRRRSFDLEVLDQYVLLTLSRFPESPFRHLEAELSAIRGATPAEVVTSILKLEEYGLLQRAPVTGLVAEERRFILTRAAGKVVHHIPPVPRSPTLFYS